MEGLEEKMQKLHEARASVFLERKTTDNDDEMMEVDAAVKAAMSVFIARGRGNSLAMIDAAKSAAATASVPWEDQQIYWKARFDSKRLSSMEIDSSTQKIEGGSGMDENDSDRNMEGRMLCKL
ncbi:hypothetical protein OIU76_012811 [Salix suchowensis]|uniref:Uncharacterized protein n=1 Tax=Salix koriyanagi TaxID=2511006 RepID=A0A9Q0WTK7_9ROSI|nr:hypothetical protein OIU76_012811 [Salix suchowensis]KAJ6773297.1 hypothetical protein OIU74_019320 [Salix koriyanagi]